jgi:MYXO-CTERM domain-containing protein
VFASVGAAAGVLGLGLLGYFVLVRRQKNQQIQPVNVKYRNDNDSAE